ncbi:MAG: hypothetical protein ACRC28_17120 [Clostridium sp.]|uniref:hypothetical protein n=1 Tax=Clostridium sp. TaxID=1506 RepID=UPI003F38C00C
MEKKEILKITEKVFNYVLNLDDETIQEFLEEKAILKIEKVKVAEKEKEALKEIEEGIGEKSREIKKVDKPKKAEAKKKAEAPKNNEFEKVTSREEALALLSDKNLKKDDLKKIAKEKNIYIKSKDTKAQIIDKIIEGTIGSKLRNEVLSKQ